MQKNDNSLFQHVVMTSPSITDNDADIEINIDSDTDTDTSQVHQPLYPLSDAEIASVMNPDRLNQLLTQADAFTRVNSEDLDDF
ncbi:conserved hypothetical protein [Enhydrobacter sp. AX1]|nr:MULTISPECIES: hypothetical protein [Pseudomonadota]VXB38280.1 conserved hypothetical protein [Enhydrobacter sp. AX1]